MTIQLFDYIYNYNYIQLYMTSCTKKIIIQLLCHCELFIQHMCLVMMMMMMMMMMNCFCGMVDWWKALSFISSQDHCLRSSPSQISDTLQAGFEPVQNLSSDFVEWSCAVVITTTPHTAPLFTPLVQLKK